MYLALYRSAAERKTVLPRSTASIHPLRRKSRSVFSSVLRLAAINEMAWYPGVGTSFLGVASGFSSRSPLGPELAEHLRSVLKVRLEVAPHNVQNLDQHGITQRIKDLVAFLAIGHNLAAAEYGKVLRYVGLLNAKPFLNHSGRNFPMPQHLDDGDPGWVAQGLKDARLIGPQEIVHCR